MLSELRPIGRTRVTCRMSRVPCRMSSMAWMLFVGKSVQMPAIMPTCCRVVLLFKCGRLIHVRARRSSSRHIVSMPSSVFSQ